MILLLDNYDSFTYNLAQYLGQMRQTLVVRRNDQISLDEIADLRPERIVISPGPGTPDEAGVAFAVKPEKGEFIGRDALVAARLQAPDRRLCCLVLEDSRSVCLGSEPVRVNGEIAGRVTTGGYGFAVQRSIAYAYLPASSSETGTRVEVEVFGEWIPAEVAAEPVWDPSGERIRA